MESITCYRIRLISCAVSLVIPIVWAEASSHAAAPVSFDVQPVVACRDVAADDESTEPTAQRLVEVPFQVSALLHDRSSVVEYFYRIDCQDGVEIVDYSPQTELASRYAENIAIEDKQEDSQSLGVSLNGNLPTFAAGSAGADVGNKQQKVVRYASKPPLETVTASGTLNRGRGVYFRFRLTPQQTLEGAKRFSLVLRVPDGWQSGYVSLTCQARCLQKTYPGVKPKVSNCASQRFLVTLHESGNDRAKRAAERFRLAEQQLRAVSVAKHQQVKKRAYPSFVHRIGAAVDLYEPRIPQDWLPLVMAGKVGPRDAMVAAFPSEVREAIQEFWESRSAVTRLRESEIEKS